ncbi:hypothetical protein LCM4579_12915 [Ensifer sp. LCM 4579]|nr:hypothetical protein [Ensifer sp. LCM 4579]OHV72208.1 hypothetical protein LCM4579_12915 [Ensifer sp. LCM 4579]
MSSVSSGMVGRSTGDRIILILAISLALLMMAPIAWVVAMSLKDNKELMATSWNDYFWPLISGTKKEMYTLTIGIASTQTNFAQSEGLGFLMSQAVFAGAPILILYLFFQKYIVTAVSGAAVR